MPACWSPNPVAIDWWRKNNLMQIKAASGPHPYG